MSKFAEKLKSAWKGLSKPKKALVVFAVVFVLIAIAQTNQTPTQTTNQTAKAEQAQVDPAEAERQRVEAEQKAQAEAAAEAERKVKDMNTILESDKGMLQELAKTGIKSVLKAPSTAEFQGGFLDPFNGWQIGKLDGKENVAVVNSVVDSENSFGAMIRSEFSVVFCKHNGNFDLMYYTFDGQRSPDYPTACSG